MVKKLVTNPNAISSKGEIYKQAAAKGFLRSRLCWQLQVRKSKAHASSFTPSVVAYAKYTKGPA